MEVTPNTNKWFQNIFKRPRTLQGSDSFVLWKQMKSTVATILCVGYVQSLFEPNAAKNAVKKPTYSYVAFAPEAFKSTYSYVAFVPEAFRAPH
jgi:hypothetical protein